MPYNPGDILFDKYKVQTLLGKGAFGEVYLVTHKNLGVLRALKVLKRDAPGIGSYDYTEAQTRFQLEAQLGAQLNMPVARPHLLQVHDCILSDNVSLLEMEYASGGSLAARLQKARESGGRLEVEQALRIATEIAEGLSALHEHDYVHRDLKPSNILFDEQGHTRVADLGLTQVPGGPSLRSQLSEPRPHPGTPGYMSPEQENSGKLLKPPSDVYALGLVLFEMLTGRNYSLLKPGTRAASLRKDLPQALDDLLAKMLAKSPDDRPWDGAEAAGLLRDVLLNTGSAARRAEEAARLEAEEARLRKELAEQVRKQAEETRLQKEKELAEQARKQAEEARLRREKELAEQARKQAEEARLRREKELVEQARKLAEEEKKRKELIIELAPDVTMVFVRVPAGAFLMGSDPSRDKQAESDEQPQHKVILDEYLIGKYPVTNRQYQAFTQAIHRKNGKIPAGKENHPVVFVNWQNAIDFCEWATKVSGVRVRLPREAEWEKAARGGDGRLYPWGDQAPDAARSNFINNVQDTTPVGKYSPQGDSPYGCADMAGNVWEWVADWYAEDFYKNSPDRNPSGPSSGQSCVLRGGSWGSSVSYLRSASRDDNGPSGTGYGIGFRCACAISPSGGSN